jgi:DNA-binding FrmR family transcriptional regulator
MISARRPFAEIAQQLLAARGSLDSLLVRLVEVELDDCLPATDARDEVDDLGAGGLSGRASSGARGGPDARRPDA